MPEDIDKFILDVQASKSTANGSDQVSVVTRYREALEARGEVRIVLTGIPHPSLMFCSFVVI